MHVHVHAKTKIIQLTVPSNTYMYHAYIRLLYCYIYIISPDQLIWKKNYFAGKTCYLCSNILPDISFDFDVRHFSV